MAQNKLNIVLLAVVFAASVAAGYFIADIVMPKKQVVEVYEEPETVDETDYYQEDTVQYVEEPVVEEEVVVEEETPVEPEVVLPVFEQYTAAEMEALINQRSHCLGVIHEALQRSVIHIHQNCRFPPTGKQCCRSAAHSHIKYSGGINLLHG